MEVYMSNQLPARPNFEHLKTQATDLLRLFREGRELSRLEAVFPNHGVVTLVQAQLVVAREYGFESWAKLKSYVFSLQEAGKLKEAIDREDFGLVRQMMTSNPSLHEAPIGYGQNGPLTWVAECRIPWGEVSPARLEIAEWMIANGSDVHQGGDGPLMRAALMGYRVPMMELLVAYGADVNAEWGGSYPIVFAPCETMEPIPLKWLLEHGADPNCDKLGRRYSGTALDMVIETYVRSESLKICMQILVDAGGITKYQVPPVLDILSGRLDSLEAQLDQDPTLLHRRFPQLEFGQTGGRLLTLKGCTLLHVAAEYGNVDAARLLLRQGADPNARADVDLAGVGGQTPIFHAGSQGRDWGLAVVQLLLDSGADLNIRCKLPGHYDQPEELVECTPLEYAHLFSGEENQTVKLLRAASSP